MTETEAMVLPIPMDSSSFLAAEAGDLATLEHLAAKRMLEPDKALAGAAKAGHVAVMAWCAERDATEFDRAMACAAGAGQIEAMAWCAERGAKQFARAMAWAARAAQTEAMGWCAKARHFARGDRAFTRAMGEAVLGEKYEAAELCLAWGGDINDSWFDNCNDRWVAAARAGEIRVEPRDPLEAFQPLGPFKFYD